jgi:hypothetical protein
MNELREHKPAAGDFGSAGSEFVVLSSFNSPLEANLARAKLEDAEIPCFLTGEALTMATIGYIANAVSLHVPRDRSLEAKQLLDRKRSIDMTPEEFHAENDEANSIDVVPEELELNTKPNVDSKGATPGLVLALGAVLFLGNHNPLILIALVAAAWSLKLSARAILHWRRIDYVYKLMALLAIPLATVALIVSVARCVEIVRSW